MQRILDRDPRIVEADVEPAVLGRDLVDEVVDVGLVATSARMTASSLAEKPRVATRQRRRGRLWVAIENSSPSKKHGDTSRN